MIIGGLVAGVAFFLLGWLIYGMLLQTFMTENFNQCANLPMEEMKMGALASSNFFFGFLLAIVLGWSNTSGLSSGLQRGLLIGLLLAGAYDLNFYSMTTMYKNVNALLVDVGVTTVMWGIVGGIIGLLYASGKKETNSAS